MAAHRTSHGRRRPIKRGELFDEADLDAALARFDELRRPAPRLENAASRVVERYLAHFAARDWDAMADMLADDIFRRRSSSRGEAGVRSGRDAEIANVQAIAEVGMRRNDVDRHRDPRGAPRPQSSVVHGCATGPKRSIPRSLDVVEIDADNRMSAYVVFDPDDIDAAFEELDARYLAGEAAPYADTWSVIAEAYAAFNRQELPPLHAGLGEHRPPPTAVAFAPGDLTAYIRAGRDTRRTSRSTSRLCIG